MSIGTGTGAAQRQLEPGKSPRPGKAWMLALACLVGAWVLLAGYDLIANSGQLGSSSAAAAKPSSPAPRTAAPGASGTPAAARSAAAPSRSAPTRSAAGQPAWRPLGVESVTAFGPDGAPDGDNPEIAYRILNVSTDQPWFSQWYATPEFGGLRSGTGLMLELESTATVTEVGLTLGSEPGADVQVRVGSSPSVDLPTVATAQGVGGTVRLTAATPAAGRYVLIWFTRLPPDGQGHYQVNVYGVSLDGTSS